LDPHGDNFLSVRLRANGPAGPAGEVDQLFTNNRVCVVGSSGRWLNVRYERNGRMFSGWVYDRYIAEDLSLLEPDPKVSCARCGCMILSIPKHRRMIRHVDG